MDLLERELGPQDSTAVVRTADGQVRLALRPFQILKLRLAVGTGA
ncbi:hypothetical protein [Kitasatospora sp. GP82]|nr:hypothetical protein [Kitasatospora sp. GP82]MDH6129237.1 hypothetical protein [Kitasatospora sp. GP82]